MKPIPGLRAGEYFFPQRLDLDLGRGRRLSPVTVMSMRGEHVDWMRIGEFAQRSRLSGKALRGVGEMRGCV